MSEMSRKQINSKYAIEWDDAHVPRIVNVNTGEPIPDDEPLFILRGKDSLACRLLGHYAGLCAAFGSPREHITAIDVLYERFREFATKNPARMKVPGAAPDTRSAIGKIHG